MLSANSPKKGPIDKRPVSQEVRMRKAIPAFRSILVMAILVVPAAFPQETVTLPAKPQNPRAGRVLQLREVFRISDAGGGFFFKNPGKIQPAADGGAVVVDEDEFLRFDAAGKFMVNMFRAGQGPGEFHQIENYLVRDDRVLAFQANPMKLVQMNFDGKLLGEVKPDATVSTLLGRLGDRLLAAAHAFPALDKVQKTEGELLDILWNLVLVSDEGHVEATALTYPTKWFAKRINARAFVSDNVTFLLCVLLGNGLAAVANEEFYVIKIVDPARSATLRTIQREYRRVKYEPEKPPDDPSAPRRMALPVSHFNDIQKLFAVDGSIWAVTSTIDPAKGVLVDVVSPAGEWLDSFYLPLPKGVGIHALARYPLTISGKNVFVAETLEDGRVEVVKYQIVDPR
jgi:hypothetical protein